MKLIAEIHEADVGVKNPQLFNSGDYRYRHSTKAIMINAKGEFGLVHSRKYNYYKLPGGGVEKGESSDEAIVREIMEETGYQAIPDKRLGITIEYRTHEGMIQITDGYTVKLVSETKQQATFPEPYEQEHQLEFVWVTPEQAVELTKDNAKDSYLYDPRFMTFRDHLIIKEALAQQA